jgi:hypothetical protein
MLKLFRASFGPTAQARAKRLSKTFNSWDSLMVTHLTTNQPVCCLNRAERTGSLVFNILWSNVEFMLKHILHVPSRSEIPTHM